MGEQIGRPRLSIKERNVCMAGGSGEKGKVKDKFGKNPGRE